MKSTSILTSLAGLLTVLSCGCGTALNTLYFASYEHGGAYRGGNSVYGGVILDADLAKKCITGDNGFEKQGVGVRVVAATAAVVDLPLSAVADTLTLPITIPADRCADRFGPGRSVDPWNDPLWTKIWNDAAHDHGGTADSSATQKKLDQ